MKAPLEWLRDFTDIDMENRPLAEAMTVSGSKVEEIIVTGDEIKHVYTGRILTVANHPDSDHLHVLSVDTGKDEFGHAVQIVCGAPNVYEGMICPVAVIGATLPGGFEIKRSKLRGVESFGMCCSAQELGLSVAEHEGATEDGLWDIPQGTSIGMDIKDYLGMGSVTIDFEITSNRPDCFSIEGLGREAAITLGHEFKPCVPKIKQEGLLHTEDVAKVDILCPSLCYRYCTRTIEDVTIAPSPDWMQKRLTEAGMRPINNIVDITNYVCLELGQPMHAFDLDYLKNNHIIVRLAEKGEETVTLDDTKRVLNDSMLVIADEEKVCAIAGVMGALNSEVIPTTKSILFESAVFQSVSVRKTAIRNGLRTEASSRYEKGLDPENALRALDRACELVEMLGCGKVSQGLIDVYPTKLSVPKIPFSASRVNAFLGTDIDEAFMIDILTKLGCKMEMDGDTKVCVPPTYRPDLLVDADIFEEIARFYNYNKITPSLLSGKETTLGGRTLSQSIHEKVKNYFVSQGFFEAITYSFESPKDLDRLLLSEDDIRRKQIVISNPLGEDFSVMRTSMVPSMLRIAARNANRFVPAANVFESAFVYMPNEDKNKLPDEKRVLCAFMYDTLVDRSSTELFYQMKNVISELCAILGIKKFAFNPKTDVPYLHPGRTASISINRKECGLIGFVHPDTAEAFEAPTNTVVLELDMDLLIASANMVREYQSLPKFPAVSRDIAVIVDRKVTSGEIERVITSSAGQFFESCTLFDVYEDDKLGEGKKSMAYSILFRSTDKTLSDTDILPGYEKVVKKLETVLGAKLR